MSATLSGEPPMQSIGYPLPSRVAAYAGSIVDVDGHEFIPLTRWEDEFGSITTKLRDVVVETRRSLGLEAPLPGSERDETPIGPDTVFQVKHESAPGGISLKRRLEVLNYTGVNRQIIYPGLMSLMATVIYNGADDPSIFPNLTGDRKTYAGELIHTYNGWCERQTELSPRYRFVAILISETVDELLAEVKRLLAAGIRAFWAPASSPIAGHSPAHPALDPLWALLADADAPFLTHIGAEWGGFFKTQKWRDAPAFEGWKMGGEFPLDPWTLSTFHLPTQNFLTCMIMGGVFERHPRLRFGAAEIGASWLGPLAVTLDLWYTHARKFQQVDAGENAISMRPSEYIRRNVRVSPFDVEDVGSYIRMYGFEDVYCYSSDLPHGEGGKQPMEDFATSLEGLSDDVIRKFFVENGNLLFPEIG